MNTLTIERAPCRTSVELPACGVLVKSGDQASSDVDRSLAWICN